MAGRDLAEYGRVWPDMAGSGRVMAGSSRVLAGIAGSARYASTLVSERGTPSSRSSRSGDHQRPRRDSPEYDRRDGRVVSRKYSDEPSPRHGRYESSRRTPGIAQMAMYLDSEAPLSSLVSLQLDSFLKALSVFSRFEIDDICEPAECKASTKYVNPLSAKHQQSIKDSLSANPQRATIGIHVRDIVKEVKYYLKTYSSAGMDSS
ncbi:hypothetical protein Tco_1072478 [Tanacetum coccineum]